MELQKKPKKKLVEQEQTFFTLNDELLKLFINEFKDDIPETFFERMWVANPQEQHLADLFIIAKMAEFFKKDQSFMVQLQGHCQVQTKKQIKSEDRPNYIKFRKYYETAEDLFNQKGIKVLQKCKKDVTLQSVSKDTIEKNKNSDFIKRRVVDALEKKKAFEGYLRPLIGKSFGTDVEIVVNSKDEASVIEKVREMEMKPQKYKAPVENHLYDLIRAQIRFDPEDLHPDDVSDNMDKIVQFLDQLAKEDKLIRFKSRLTELGHISCNFIYENQIVKLQIVFNESLDSLKRSQVVYDLERLKDLTAVRNYLMKKNRGMLRLFSQLKMNAFDDQVKECDKPGSLVVPHFIHYVMTYPTSKDFPSFPTDTLLTYKGWKEGKILYNEEKKVYEGFNVKVKLSDGGEYECDLINFKMVGKQGSKLPNIGKYEGERKDGKINGKGKMTYENGDVYEGNWENNKRSGKGKMTYSKGDVYEGGWKDDLRTGHGKFTWGGDWKGYVYEGNWENDKRNGEGKMNNKGGDVYEGNWRNDKKSGKGKMTYSKGDVYEGGWKDDLRTGHGKFTWGGDWKGQVYEGFWVNDQQNGEGKMNYKDGDVYEGNWKDGIVNGQGKVTYENGDVYEGNWKDAKIHGQGKMTYTNGDSYDGAWEDGIYSGWGELLQAYSRNGEPFYYSGNWENGIREGYGNAQWENGDDYQGNFSNNKLHGVGTMTRANGVVQTGEWKNNQYIRYC